MTDEPSKPASDASREQKMAEIRARAEALRAARGGKSDGGTPADAPVAAAPPSEPAASQDAAAAKPTGGEGDAEMSREDKMAAIRARAEAMKAARASGVPTAASPAAPGATAQAAPAKPTTPTAVEVPVSSVNPGGRAGSLPQAPTLEAFGTLNQSVEIRADAVEADNLKKLLGGLGAYQNPLRGEVWQIDYRYYAEARRRLQAAGYTIAEKDYLGRPLTTWNPTARGWTRVET